MPELPRSYTSDSWNLDSKIMDHKNNRSYIDPWDLENYVYMKRRLSTNVVSFKPPEQNINNVYDDEEPITSLSAKSDFYYIKSPPPIQYKTVTMLPTQQIKTIRRQSLIQEVSANIDEENFSNEMYHLNKCPHHQQPQQYYQNMNKPTRRHSSITYMQYCQHQQQKNQQQFYQQYNNSQHLQNPDDIYTPGTGSYCDSSTIGMSSWHQYNNNRSLIQLRHRQNHPEPSLQSTTSNNTTSTIPRQQSQLLYIYQRRRMSQQPQLISNNYHRRQLVGQTAPELIMHEQYMNGDNTGLIFTNNTNTNSKQTNNNKPVANPTKDQEIYVTNNNLDHKSHDINGDSDTDNGTIIYHESHEDEDVFKDEDLDKMMENLMKYKQNHNGHRKRRISKQPSNFGLSTFGHLRINYSPNWMNLDHYIGHC